MGAATPPWRVRPATIDDAEQIALVHAESERAAFRGLVPDHFIAQANADQWRQQLADHDGEWIDRVVERADGVLAFSTAGPIGRGVGRSHAAHELYALHVRPAWVRRSMGRALVEHTLAELQRRGRSTTLQALCLRGNPARLFYEALGALWIERGEHVAADGTVIEHDIYVLGRPTDGGRS